MPSRFFWTSLLLWVGFFIFSAALITQLVFPASFGIPPSLRLWKLAFNSVLVIIWIVVSGYFWRKKSPPFFASPAVSLYQALIRQTTALIVISLLLGLEVLTNGEALDIAIRLGLFMGFAFGIVSIPQIFMHWRRLRRAK